MIEGICPACRGLVSPSVLDELACNARCLECNRLFVADPQADDPGSELPCPSSIRVLRDPSSLTVIYRPPSGRALPFGMAAIGGALLFLAIRTDFTRGLLHGAGPVGDFLVAAAFVAIGLAFMGIGLSSAVNRSELHLSRSKLRAWTGPLPTGANREVAMEALDELHLGHCTVHTSRSTYTFPEVTAVLKSGERVRMLRCRECEAAAYALQECRRFLQAIRHA